MSASRNSSLLADISRLQKQVKGMNVSVNRLERARGNYDRYVETCMVSWIQKSFRETGTESRHSPGTTQEQTPTKTIGVQTSLEHSTTQLSDWSISPDTLIHSTLLVPEVSDRLPPRDTSRPPSRHPRAKPSVDVSSVMPSVINFSDLRDPTLPLQDTFSTPRADSVLSAPTFVTSEPTLQSGMPAGNHSTPLYPHPHTFQSIPNVSMIPQPYLHSYVLPQQPVVYPGIPFSPALATTPMPLPATYQPTMPLPATSIPPVPLPATYQPTMPLPATYQPRVPLSATYMPPVPLPATYQPRVLLSDTYIPHVPLLATCVAPTTLSESSAPLSATFKPQLESPLAVEVPTFEYESTESLPLPEIPVPQVPIATLPLSDTIPQAVKSPPPPPKSSVLSPSKPTPQSFEPSATHLSHSRQSSVLPTIPEPFVPLYDHFPDSQPPPATLHTSAGMRRVESAHEFAVDYPVNQRVRESVDLGVQHPPDLFDTITPSQNLSGSVHTSESHKSDYELDSDSSGREKRLKSTPNQFDLTALLVQESGSEQEVSGLDTALRKPSQVMTESPTVQPLRDHILVLNNLSATLNIMCQSGAPMYGDTFDHQLAESNVVSNKILSQAATSEVAQLASWDIQILRNVFLEEISKVTLTNGAILTPDVLSQPNLDLNSFNRILPLGCVPLWECLVGHFSALFKAKTSLQDICATFVPLLVAPASSETVKLGSQVLTRVLNEIFGLKEEGVGSRLESEPELYQEEAYRSLLKSMTLKSVEEGVKSGSLDDLVSAASSLLSEGSVAVPFYAGIESKVSEQEQSPTQLLDQAVGEKIQSDSSDSEPLYVPSFAPQKMTHREKRTKFEKFWGSDLDSEDSESILEPSKVVKKEKNGLDDFDFF